MLHTNEMKDPEQRLALLKSYFDMVDVIELARHYYYTLSEPILTDYDFDRLMRDLERFETTYPEVVTPRSPSQVVENYKGFVPNITVEYALDRLDNHYLKRWAIVDALALEENKDG